MRTITKFWAAVFLCACSLQSLSAKDWYVSQSGDDNKNGETPETAVKFITKLNELGIKDGDVIHIKGIIDITADPGVKDGTAGYIHQKPGQERQGLLIKRGTGWDKLTFIGEDPYSDGFTGNDKARLVRVDGASATFKNLGFQNGRDLNNDGGNGLWCRGQATDLVTVENCVFMNNNCERDPVNPANMVKSNGRGGAILKMETGNLDIYNCTFLSNYNRFGSGVYIGGGKVNIVGCDFTGNNANTSEALTVGGSNGGAIYMLCLTPNPIEATIDHCLFYGNGATVLGGAIAVNENLSRPGAYSNLTIKNSTIMQNVSTDRGGGIGINNSQNVPHQTTIINTTFWGNQSKNEGGAIMLWGATPNSKFTMVNSTVSGNISEGNGGHGPGLVSFEGGGSLPNSNVTKRFYNCIFDDNYALDNNKNTLSDFTIRTVPVEGELEIYNSFVGKLSHAANTPDALWHDCDKNYITVGTLELRDPDIHNHAGIVTSTNSDSEYYMTGLGQVYFLPLLDENSPAFFFGKAQWLTDFGITTDQLGNTRKIIAEDCAVGAVEATVQQADDGEFIFTPILTGVKETTGEKAEITIVNGVIRVNTQEKAKLTLYNFNGGIEKQADNQININGLNGGFYIVKATVDNKTLVKKVRIR